MQGTLAALVLLFPAAGGLVLAGRGWRWPRLLTQIVGPGVVWAAFVCVVVLLAGQLSASRPPVSDIAYWTWIKSASFYLPFNLVVDNLSVFMALVITGVGALIVTYSVGYMEHENDASYARFFCYMDIFVFSMLLLVLAGNVVFLIVGWGLVGLSSYLLIGFWYDRPSAVLAARKAFVMNVIGDVGMILAAFAMFLGYHSLALGQHFPAFARHGDDFTNELIAFLLLVGAVAKSAQLPLHTWLPDAMEGPTPVSALIHAATMVTAGVYLVGRFAPLYDVASMAHHTVAIIGTLTALMAATIAIVQTDIKRVLAYSTMSQIGYMFLAVGVGAYAAGFFHLMAHAFFKALLFMAAGNVIHVFADEQDMRRFGGLWKDMRVTAFCFGIGALALVGIFPLAGFWSKELILGDAFSKPADSLAQILWLVGFLTALLTGFYTGRMWWLSFWRPASPGRPVVHVHEVALVMLAPVAVLTFLSTFGGFLQPTAGFNVGPRWIEDFLAPAVGALPWQPRGLEWIATAATLLLSGFTFLLAYTFYVGAWRGYRFRPWSERLPWAQRILERKYYWDELYDMLFVRPMDWLAQRDQRVDNRVIDAALTGVGDLAHTSASELSLTQTGYFRSYALVFVIGAVVAAGILLIRLAF